MLSVTDDRQETPELQARISRLAWQQLMQNRLH